MDESITQYFAESTPLSLTLEERAAGRLALQAKMALTLAEDEKIAARRALQQVVFADPAPTSIWEIFRMPARLSAMAFSALLLLGASGGGLYAAESALPGDPLYRVKIHVNEAIRGTLQISPEDRARWAVARLQRRMDELRALEARGSAEAEIDVAIGGHIEVVAKEVEAEVHALPAAAAERAAMRTAVNAAIGADQDSLRRASRINRVLKALKERADQFDAPPVGTIAPVPAAVRETVRQALPSDPLRVEPKPIVDTTVSSAASSRAAETRSSKPSAAVRSSQDSAVDARSSAGAIENIVDDIVDGVVTPADDGPDAPAPIVPSLSGHEDLPYPPPAVPEALDNVL